MVDNIKTSDKMEISRNDIAVIAAGIAKSLPAQTTACTQPRTSTGLKEIYTDGLHHSLIALEQCRQVLVKNNNLAKKLQEDISDE